MTTKLKHYNQPISDGPVRPLFRAAVQSDGALEMLVYGEIVDSATASMLEVYGVTDGFISAANVKKQLDSAGEYSKIVVRINSPGGDAFEGIAIHNLLRSQGKPVETIVDGVAASSASIVAMAGDVRSIGNSATMMIHNPWTACIGDADDMRKTANTLDVVAESIAECYMDRTGMSRKRVIELMGEETWMSAKDCVEAGFCTRITSRTGDPAAQALAAKFKALTNSRIAARSDHDCECGCESCEAGDCSACTHDGCDCENCEDCPMSAGVDNKRRSGGRAKTPKSNLSLYQAKLDLLRLKSPN